jgi:hypothetical protein
MPRPTGKARNTTSRKINRHQGPRLICIVLGDADHANEGRGGPGGAGGEAARLKCEALLT